MDVVAGVNITMFTKQNASENLELQEYDLKNKP